MVSPWGTAGNEATGARTSSNFTNKWGFVWAVGRKNSPNSTTACLRSGTFGHELFKKSNQNKLPPATYRFWFPRALSALSASQGSCTPPWLQMEIVSEVLDNLPGIFLHLLVVSQVHFVHICHAQRLGHSLVGVPFLCRRGSTTWCFCLCLGLWFYFSRIFCFDFLFSWRLGFRLFHVPNCLVLVLTDFGHGICCRAVHSNFFLKSLREVKRKHASMQKRFKTDVYIMKTYENPLVFQ